MTSCDQVILITEGRRQDEQVAVSAEEQERQVAGAGQGHPEAVRGHGGHVALRALLLHSRLGGWQGDRLEVLRHQRLHQLLAG